jgi:hypothetical protein
MPRLKKQADAATNSEEGGRVNKMEIVRKALGKLGDKAKPKEMHAYILKTYKVEIGTDTISNYKSRRQHRPRRRRRSTAASTSRTCGPSRNWPTGSGPPRCGHSWRCCTSRGRLRLHRRGRAEARH